MTLYESADFYVGRLGWRLVFATPKESGDRMALVALGDAHVHLGTADERWLPARSRAHRGAGVTVYIRLPASADISAVPARHAAAGVLATPLAARPWGELAFDAVIEGYRFLIGQEAAAVE
jgi:catechol 2,3-dioxygenase-like lactoylglutathione lyase family enzyme